MAANLSRLVAAARQFIKQHPLPSAQPAWTKQTVTDATEMWIHKVVHNLELWPLHYAAKSAYEIIVNPTTSTKDVVQDVLFHSRRLASTSHDTTIDSNEVKEKFRSYLLVYPKLNGRSIEVQDGAYFEAVAKSKGLIGTANDIDPVDERMEIQAVPFTGMDPRAAFREGHLPAMAPFETIQRLKYEDLRSTRGFDHCNTVRIVNHNQDLSEALEPEEIAQIFFACQHSPSPAKGE